MVSNSFKWFVLAITFLLWYLAVYFGDGVLGYGDIARTLLVAAIALIAWFAYGVWEDEGFYFLGRRSPILACASCLAAALAFGGIAQPISNFGFWPTAWATPWLFLPAVSLIPVLIELVIVIASTVNTNGRRSSPGRPAPWPEAPADDVSRLRPR